MHIISFEGVCVTHVILAPGACPGRPSRTRQAPFPRNPKNPGNCRNCPPEFPGKSQYHSGGVKKVKKKPRCMGSKVCSCSHAAWESFFRFFQHLCSESALQRKALSLQRCRKKRKSSARPAWRSLFFVLPMQRGSRFFTFSTPLR